MDTCNTLNGPFVSAHRRFCCKSVTAPLAGTAQIERISAVEHFNRAISFKPTLVEAHFNLGVIYINDGLLDMAREKFETVLILDPDYPGTAMWLKYVHEMKGQSGPD